MKTLASCFLLICSSILCANTFYLDPTNGSINNDGSILNPLPSLQDVFNSSLISRYKYSPVQYTPSSVLVPVNAGGLITGGDTLVLLGGLHGNFDALNAHNMEYITIIGAEGQKAYVQDIRIRSGSKWRFENLYISRELYGFAQGTLVSIEKHSWHGPAYDCEIKNCHIYSISESDAWTQQSWLDSVSTAINIKADRINVLDNTLKNIGFGITFSGDSCVARGNQIINFSGDGIRLLGPNLVAENNLIMNCIDIDENHDDGIQSFNLGTNDVRDITVRGNMIISGDTLHPLRGALQGIGCFDGPFDNWVVENNVVIVNHYHGISFYGCHGCSVVNNTVLDPTPDDKPGPAWIRVGDDKQGNPSTNCIIKNNISNSLNSIQGAASNNITIATYALYDQYFEDYTNNDFRLKLNSPAINAGVNLASPILDIDHNPRIYDNTVDAGAYEYSCWPEMMLTGKTIAFPTYLQAQNEIELQGIKIHSALSIASASVKVEGLNSIGIGGSIEVDNTNICVD